MPRLFALTVSLLALSANVPATAGSVVKSIPGPDGGWDYARIDARGTSLFVARGQSVSVFDLKGTAPVRSIGDISHGHAVLPLPDGHILLVTSGQDATVRFLDIDKGTELGRVPVGEDPDAAVLDASGRTAYTMNAKAGTISKIDTATRTVTATVTVRAGLEYAALASGGALFVNNEDENTLTAVDTRTNRVSAVIALTGCEGPSGLAYDAHSDRLIAACANGKAALVDASKKQLLKLLDIGQGPDAVILDEQRRRAYIPCGKSGELDVIALDATGGPAVTGHITTEAGARTGALDPTDGMVYLPTGKFGPAPGPGKRGAMIPGSFHILAIQP